MAGWRPEPLSEGHPCPRTAHAAYGAPGPASAGHPYPLRYPGPPWALGLPRPTSPVPGVPTQRYSPFAATLPARQQGSCTPLSRYRAYSRTNSKTTSIFVNLTHPLTHITLTPGSLGWESLLPQLLIAPCIPHSLHTHRLAGLTHSSCFHSSLITCSHH